jgi:hypothetical protein
MYYVTYSEKDQISIFITDDIVEFDDDQIEFGHTYLSGMLDKNNPQWNGFAGQESFFILQLDDGFDSKKMTTRMEWSGYFAQAVNDIIDSIQPKNQRESVMAIFGEKNPEGNI